MSKKRKISPEHLAKLQAGRIRAQEANKNKIVEKPGAIWIVDELTILDLTKENVIHEADLLERIRLRFDDGQFPETVRVTSRQMMDILDNSNRLMSYTQYDSPFGAIAIQVIPAKDIV